MPRFSQEAAAARISAQELNVPLQSAVGAGDSVASRDTRVTWREYLRPLFATRLLRLSLLSADVVLL